jgi:hypothetical protein
LQGIRDWCGGYPHFAAAVPPPSNATKPNSLRLVLQRNTRKTFDPFEFAVGRIRGWDGQQSPICEPRPPKIQRTDGPSMSLQELKSHPSLYWSSPLHQEHASPGPPPIITKGFHPTRWGWFPWAPENWESSVQPDDLAIAGYLIPSPRILAVNRSSDADEYSIYNYGCLTFRMKPELWREIPNPGFHLGQTVEISKIHSPHEPARVVIEEVYWEPIREKVMFLVSKRGQLWPDGLEAHEFINPQDSSFLG